MRLLLFKVFGVIAANALLFVFAGNNAYAQSQTGVANWTLASPISIPNPISSGAPVFSRYRIYPGQSTTFDTPQQVCEYAVSTEVHLDDNIDSITPPKIITETFYDGSAYEPLFVAVECKVRIKKPDTVDLNGNVTSYPEQNAYWTIVPSCLNGQKIGVRRTGSGSAIELFCGSTKIDVETGNFRNPGQSGIASAPRKTVGDPVEVDTGAVTSKETDYSTADGLLRVDREYRNAATSTQGEIAQGQLPGFGLFWRGMLPGQITACPDQSGYKLSYTFPSGGSLSFSTENTAGWLFVSGQQSRLKMSMVLNPPQIPSDYFGPNGLTSSPNTVADKEVKLSFANGDILFFRRSAQFDAASGCRPLVPVEKKMAGGYSQNFDYTSVAVSEPIKVRDSLNRELQLTWADAGSISSSLGGYTSGPESSATTGMAAQKNLSEVLLPDGTRLKYQYAAPDSSGYLGRLQAVQRVSATNTTLWARKYLHEDNRHPLSMTGVLDQNDARITNYAYDESGRATVAERAGGYDRHTLSYNDDGNQRTVTGPLGLDTNYQYAPQSGSFTQPCLANCSGSGWAPVPSDPPNPTCQPIYSPSERIIGWDCENDEDDIQPTPQGSQGPTVNLTGLPRLLLSETVAGSENSASSTVQYSYDSDGLLTYIKDGNGNLTSQYNAAQEQRSVTITDAKGVEAQLEWHPIFDLATKVERPGQTITYDYYASGLLLSEEIRDSDYKANNPNYGQRRTRQFQWDNNGRLLSVSRPDLDNVENFIDQVQYTYDTNGNRLTATNALGQVTSYANYDANGRPGEMTDLNGIKMQYAYDELGRVKEIRVKHPSDATLDAITRLAYDVEGRVVQITRPDNGILAMDYDPAGRLTVLRTGDGERIDYTHDAMGNILTTSVKAVDRTQARAIQRSFDLLGRISSETLGPGRTTLWTYDKNNNVVKTQTPRGNVIDTAFDAVDQLVSMVASGSGSSGLVYDERGNVTNASDGGNVETRFIRNGFGEAVVEISPDRGESRYYYDLYGRMTSSMDGRGQFVYYSYDILDRMTRKDPAGSPQDYVRYVWDVPGITGSYGIGRLSRVEDTTGITKFAYDHRGNIITKQQKIGGASTPFGSLRYAYDLSDRIVRVTYPSGRQVRYSRDANGRVDAVYTKANATIATWSPVATGIRYEPFGPLRAANFANGLRVVMNWGDEGQLVGRRLYRVSDSANLSHLNYSYDADGNITRIRDNLVAANTQDYRYDAAGRLSRVTTAAAPVQRVDYLYDANGNRTQTQRRASPTDTVLAGRDSYAYQPGSNKLSTITTRNGSSLSAASITGTRAYTLDERGNMVVEDRGAGLSVNAAYDAYGRLTGYARSGEASLSHSYNGLDDRVASVTAAAGGGSIVTQRFVYDARGRILGEYGTDSTQLRAEFIWLNPEGSADDGVGGHMPLALSLPDLAAGAGASQLVWSYGNHLGVPLVTSNASGQVIAMPGGYNAAGFPGQSRTFADLYYNRYRDFDSVTGRYIQADPIGLAGGSNPYSYALNNPVRFTDPSGKAVPFAALCIVGGAVGAASTGLGELASKGGTSFEHLAISAGVGCVAGMAAPLVATSSLGATVLGALSNSGQYAATQYADGKAITPGGLALNFFLGGLAGKFAGSFTPRGNPHSTDLFSWMAPGTRDLHRSLNEQRMIDVARREALSSIADGVANTIVADPFE